MLALHRGQFGLTKQKPGVEILGNSVTAAAEFTVVAVRAIAKPLHMEPLRSAEISLKHGQQQWLA